MRGVKGATSGVGRRRGDFESECTSIHMPGQTRSCRDVHLVLRWLVSIRPFPNSRPSDTANSEEREEREEMKEGAPRPPTTHLSEEADDPNDDCHTHQHAKHSEGGVDGAESCGRRHVEWLVFGIPNRPGR